MAYEKNAAGPSATKLAHCLQDVGIASFSSSAFTTWQMRSSNIPASLFFFTLVN